MSFWSEWWKERREKKLEEARANLPEAKKRLKKKKRRLIALLNLPLKKRGDE